MSEEGVGWKEGRTSDGQHCCIQTLIGQETFYSMAAQGQPHCSPFTQGSTGSYLVVHRIIWQPFSLCGSPITQSRFSFGCPPYALQFPFQWAMWLRSQPCRYCFYDSLLSSVLLLSFPSVTSCPPCCLAQHKLCLASNAISFPVFSASGLLD